MNNFCCLLLLIMQLLPPRRGEARLPSPPPPPAWAHQLKALKPFESGLRFEENKTKNVLSPKTTLGLLLLSLPLRVAETRKKFRNIITEHLHCWRGWKKRNVEKGEINWQTFIKMENFSYFSCFPSSSSTYSALPLGPLTASSKRTRQILITL